MGADPVSGAEEHEMVEHGHDQHEGHPHGHESHERPGQVMLTELADALLDDLPNHSAGRTAKTVLSGTVIRAVVVALGEGVEMSEHDSPPGATLQVLRGRVSLWAGDREWDVRPGQLVQVPPQRHSVHAHEPSAFLLTVALR
jgi:quercetin dioxygenase-like cupin family protein